MTATRKARKTITAKAATVTVNQAPPASPLTLADYREDIVARWNIHTYEFNAAARDLYELGKQLHNAVDAVVEYATPHYNTVVSRLSK